MSKMSTFRRHMGRNPGKTAKFSVQGIKPYKAAPQAILQHYWHPERTGSEPAPEDIRLKLATIHADLDICRPPPRAPVRVNCWLVWYRCPRVTHVLSPGWLLLFPWLDEADQPLPLDDGRVFANIYARSTFLFKNSVQYFQHILDDMRASTAAKENLHKDDLDQRRKSFYDFTKISNIGRGNKFALHHDGTILPGRGERNWLNDLSYQRMPDESRREFAERRTGFNLTNRVTVDMGAASLKGALLTEQRIFDVQLQIARLVRERREHAMVPVRTPGSR
jgi:hypothetical protein